MVDFYWNGKRPMLSLFKTKGDKQTIKNYRPVSLLPICGKIFERLLYDTMFDFIYFLQINLDSDREILVAINFFQLIMKS